MQRFDVSRQPPEWPAVQFEADARQWDDLGRPTPDATPLYAAVLYLWVQPRRTRVSARLNEFQGAVKAALDAASRGWYDALLRERAYCVECSTQYKLENLGICATCGATWCGAHQGLGGISPDGGRRCDACKRGEIVG